MALLSLGGSHMLLMYMHRVVKKTLSSRRIREGSRMCFPAAPVGEDISLLIYINSSIQVSD